MNLVFQKKIKNIKNKNSYSKENFAYVRKNAEIKWTKNNKISSKLFDLLYKLIELLMASFAIFITFYDNKLAV
jgi:hypothetical protein